MQCDIVQSQYYYYHSEFEFDKKRPIMAASIRPEIEFPQKYKNIIIKSIYNCNYMKPRKIKALPLRKIDRIGKNSGITIGGRNPTSLTLVHLNLHDLCYQFTHGGLFTPKGT